MKKRTFYVLITTMLFITFHQTLSAQTKRAMFLHGYSSNPDVAWKKIPRADNGYGDVPYRWMYEGIIEDTVTPNLGAIVDEQVYVKTILTAMTQHDPNNNSRWIMIGHSLGGLAARAIEPYVKNGLTIPNVLSFPPRNLKGIITLGTPHQGAPAAGNLASAQPIADDVRNKIKSGPQWQSTYGWTGYFLNPFGYDFIYSVGATVFNYFYLADALGKAHASVSKYIADATKNDAARLAPNSDWLYTNVLSKSSTVPHVSISGVESTPHTLMRFVSTIDDLGAVTFTNENDAVDKMNNAQNFYQGYENYHEQARHSSDWTWIVATAWATANWYIHNEGMIHWRYGREAIQNLDVTWAGLANATLSSCTSGSYQVWVPCSGYYDYTGTGGSSYHDLETMFQTVDDYNCQQHLVDGYWKTVYYTYCTYYQDRWDGFIPRSKTVWQYGESIIDNPIVSDASVGTIEKGNVCFDGTGEADGGYNHGELRYWKKNYGTHMLSTPMQFAKTWTDVWLKR